MTNLPEYDWAVWLAAGAWQGGEVVDGLRCPMTGRSGSRGFAVRRLQDAIDALDLGLPIPKRVRTAEPEGVAS